MINNVGSQQLKDDYLTVKHKWGFSIKSELYRMSRKIMPTPINFKTATDIVMNMEPKYSKVTMHGAMRLLTAANYRVSIPISKVVLDTRKKTLPSCRTSST